MKFLSLLLLSSSLLLGACAKNPVTGDNDFALVTEAEEIEQGRSYHSEIIRIYGLYDAPLLQKYVNRIGQDLAAKSQRADLEFHFTVLDSPEINAFALPGGYVYITRGIMAYLDSEAELAGVLGHEIGHVTARHSVRQQAGQLASNLLGVLISATTGQAALGNLSQQFGTGLIRGYGREYELEADRLGAEYLYANDYDPDSMLEVIGVLKDQEVYETRLAAQENRPANIYHGVYSTHPQNDDRLKTVVRAAKKLPNKIYRDANQAPYLEQIDGLVWGPGLRQGVVVNNRFSYPDLAIAMQLPEGWKVDNNPRFLAARDPQSSAMIQVSVVPLEKNETPGAALERLTRDKELEIEDTDNGVTATFTVNTGHGQARPARIIGIPLDSMSLLALVGTADKKHFTVVDSALLRTGASLQKLDATQVAAIRAPRLRIIPRGSQSFKTLAEQSALDYEAVNILRLLNRSFPSGKIDKLDLLKTVTLDNG